MDIVEKIFKLVADIDCHCMHDKHTLNLCLVE